MLHKVLVGVLVVVCVAIFAFVGTYGGFVALKERWCAKSLYSSDCYMSYPQFMRGLVVRH